VFSHPPRPLAVGIRKKIAEALAPEVTEQEVGRALKEWTGSRGYQLALARAGAMRFDLRGVAVEPVDRGHGAFALERFHAMRPDKVARAQAQAQQQQQDKRET
jgi:sRNA-binding protein